MHAAPPPAPSRKQFSTRLTLKHIHNSISVPTTFTPIRPGAEVWARAIDPEDERLGAPWARPFTSRELPFGMYRFRIVKPGFQTVLAQESARLGPMLQFDLDAEGSSRGSGARPGMVCHGTEHRAENAS